MILVTVTKPKTCGNVSEAAGILSVSEAAGTEALVASGSRVDGLAPSVTSESRVGLSRGADSFWLPGWVLQHHQ